MKPLSMSEDRTVHAIAGTFEIVRYNRSGKWYIEDANSHYRKHVGIAEAVALAWSALRTDKGEAFFGLPGGGAFDRRLRDAESDGGSWHG